MAAGETQARELYRLEEHLLFTSWWKLLFLKQPRRADYGHAGVSIVRESDGKIVAIVTDDSYDSRESKAQLEADIEVMTAFEFEQTWGVNTACSC